MTIQRWTTVAVVAALATLGLAGGAWAWGNSAGPFDFSGTQYADEFRDVRRGGDINSGTDLAGGGHSALNFTGSTGSAGDTWITVYKEETAFDADTGICMHADVLIHRFNNRKGAGLVALLNEGPGGNGLALLLYDNGNTDALVLNLVDPNTGKLTKLASVALGSGIAENAWYRVFLNLLGGSGTELSVNAQVRSHSDPSNPNSSITSLVGSTLLFTGAFEDLGLEHTGEVGLIASAISAVVDSSATNFEANDDCAS